jgi:hypothetical protein
MERSAPGIKLLLSAELDQLLYFSNTTAYDVTMCALCPAGVLSCYIMERFAPGINFVLSAELDQLWTSCTFQTQQSMTLKCVTSALQVS